MKEYHLNELPIASQKKVGLARALATQPKLLMLDEVARLKESGKTILLVEQNVREALELSDRGYVLQTGRTIYHGTGRDLLNTEIIKKAFLGL